MTRKIYRHRGLLAVRMVLRVGTEIKTVEFTGGTANGEKIFGGTFSTTDPDIQKAIEAREEFKNKIIFVEMAVKLTPEQAKEEIANTDSTDNTGGTPPLEELEPLKDSTIDNKGGDTELTHAGVTNTQGAKEILMTVYKIDPKELEGDTSVIVAKAKAMNLLFPDWVTYNK